jgi:hypothetical protein
MKRVIVLSVAVLMFSGVAFAEECIGFIGLYSNEGHTNCGAVGVGFYPVEMWIWCTPNSIIGMICAEFMISYPANVITSTVIKNVPIISVDMGDYASGYSVCFIECQYDWTWPGHQLIYVTDATQTQVHVVKHPDPNIECIQMADCTPGYPTYCVCFCPPLYINTENDPCQPCATEKTCWGAIKELFNK